MLRISTKGRYAVRIMVYLAQNARSAPSPRNAIARSEGISPDYVEQILGKLRASGLVRSHRGTRGGFSLARAAAAITVADVVAATEGPIVLVPCEEERCARASVCVAQALWQKAGQALQSVFAGVTIKDLARQARDLAGAEPPTYEI